MGVLGEEECPSLFENVWLLNALICNVVLEIIVIVISCSNKWSVLYDPIEDLYTTVLMTNTAMSGNEDGLHFISEPPQCLKMRQS